jgi:hypothetical protein
VPHFSRAFCAKKWGFFDSLARQKACPELAEGRDFRQPKLEATGTNVPSFCCAARRAKKKAPNPAREDFSTIIHSRSPISCDEQP